MIRVCLGSCLFRSITQPDHFNYFDSRRRERLGRSDGGQSRGWVRRVQGLAQPDRQLHQRPRVPVHRHRRRNWRRRNRAGGKDAAYGCSSVDLYLSIDAESHLLLLLNIVLEGRASIINWSEPDLGHLLVCCELSPLPSEFKEGGRLQETLLPTSYMHEWKWHWISATLVQSAFYSVQIPQIFFVLPSTTISSHLKKTRCSLWLP